MKRVCIPDYEYKERIKKAAKMLAEKGLDVMVVASTESDYPVINLCEDFDESGCPKRY